MVQSGGDVEKISAMGEKVSFMLKGEYSHNIDAKGRLIIPAKFRDDLGEHFVITKGMENCLYVYPEAEWTAFVHLHIWIRKLYS